MRARVLVSCLALTFAATAARAANEISNGDFDTGVIPWFANTEFDADHDVDGDPGSGSLRVVNIDPGTGTQALQRFAVTPGTPIRASFSVYIASGQSGIGYAYPAVNFFEGACDSGGVYLSNGLADLIDAPFDAWVSSEMPDTIAPATAGCAEVVLFVRNNGETGTFAANFDAVFAPEPGTGAGVVALAALLVRRRSRQ